jgi:hypothetical protein
VAYPQAFLGASAVLCAPIKFRPFVCMPETILELLDGVFMEFNVEEFYKEIF